MNPIQQQTVKQTNTKTFSSLKGMIATKQVANLNPYITREFQDYGCNLAERLGDQKYRALYIKLAKTYPRTILEQAYSFVADYPNASNKGKLFMWKLKQIRLAIKP